MKHSAAIVQVSLGLGTYIALRWFGVLTGWPNIPTPLIPIPVSGDTLQVLLAGVAAFMPNIAERYGVALWFEDAWLMGARTRAIYQRMTAPPQEPLVEPAKPEATE